MVLKWIEVYTNKVLWGTKVSKLDNFDTFMTNVCSYNKNHLHLRLLRAVVVAPSSISMILVGWSFSILTIPQF